MIIRSAIILILVLASSWTGIRSAETSKVYDSAKNTIINDVALYPFFKQLDSLLKLKNGKVNVVHIGDSHIQADYFSGQVRRRLQSMFGNGGRGFVFPYQIANSNSPNDIKVQHQGEWMSNSIMKGYEFAEIGASGYVVKAKDSAEFLLYLSNKGKSTNSFNKLTVFQTGGQFIPVNEHLEPLAVALGGSNHLPYASYLLSEYHDSIRMIARASGNQDVQLHGLSFENTQPGLVYHSMGTNGSSTLHYLRSTEFSKHIASLKADLVIVSFGTNDCYLPYSRFCSSCATDRFRTIIWKIKKESPNATILLTTPADHYYRRRYDNRNLWYLRKSLKRLAEEEGVALWDLYDIMGGERSIVEWRDNALARRDLIHFTKDGYQLQGNLLFQAIMDSYEGRFN
ncbi:MAG: hypothetical protein JXR19_08415 [Bacteroidia bacterium]